MRPRWCGAALYHRRDPSATCPAGVNALDDPNATPPPPGDPDPDAATGPTGPGSEGAAPSTPPTDATPPADGAAASPGPVDPAPTPPPDPTPAPGSSGGGTTGGPRGPKSKPPGLRDQFRATRDAALRLVVAHVDLAKAEATEIGGEVAKATALAIGAIVLALIAAMLLVLGTSLFLGEWLLGSMGWGIVNGFEACIAVAMTLVFVALGVAARRLVRALAIGILVGLLVFVILYLNLPNHFYAAVREASGVAVDPASAPLIAGAVLIGFVGLIVGIVLAVRMHGATVGSRIGVVLGVTLVGAAIGALTAITFNPQVAAGIGITVGYAVWIVVMAMDVARTGIDVEALKLRFTPTQTIETSKETLEWLQRRMPPGIG